MSLGSDLKDEVVAIFSAQWSEVDGRVVPEPKDIQLGNNAVKLKGSVLYADLVDSTGLVMSKKPWFAAEVFKTFLHCASKIIRDEGGTITAFDGDRVMGVFIGDSREADATRAALKIRYAVGKIINPALKDKYKTTDYVLSHVVGVDASELFIARTGIRGSNDLVWVGRAANYAAKLSARRGTYSSWITDDVYQKLPSNLKGNNGASAWSYVEWEGIRIYGSTWWVEFS